MGFGGTGVCMFFNGTGEVGMSYIGTCGYVM